MSAGYERAWEAAYTASEYAIKAARGARNVTAVVYKGQRDFLIGGIMQKLDELGEEALDV